MDKQEILAKLKTSLEVSTIRSNLIGELILVFVVCLLHGLATIGDSWQVSPWAFYGFIAAIVLVPVFGVHAFELWRIFRKAEFYRFYETRLTQPRSTYMARSFRFTVLLKDSGGTIVANTHSIFGAGKYQWGPIMEDYLNKTVTVAYNEETEEVVVIG